MRRVVGAFVLMSLIAVLAPVLAARVAHRIPVPLVAFEILLGVLFGPQGLGLGRHGEFIAITTIGTENAQLNAGTSAALVGAGMLSVPLFPVLALRLRGDRRAVAGADSRTESW